MRHELVDIDVATGRGLEIGALASPVVTKAQGEVYYVDHADREALQAKYANDEHMKTRLDEIVEVDFVLQPGQALSDAVASKAPYDYIIASHLIEHIPDIVGWLADVSSLLTAGGVLSLVIPDKRYSFDINRSVTEISDVVDAHLRHLDRPSYGPAYDFFAKALNGVVDRAQVWAGTTDYSQMLRQDCEDPYVTAYQWCRDVLASDHFVDVHCHVFTPSSLLDILDKLARMQLMGFEVSSLFPTEFDTLEFHVSLRKLDPALSPDEKKAGQLRSILAAQQAVAADEEAHRRRRCPPPPELPPGVSDLQVTRLERRLVMTKRSVVSRLRGAARWARTR